MIDLIEQTKANYQRRLNEINTEAFLIQGAIAACEELALRIKNVEAQPELPFEEPTPIGLPEVSAEGS